MSDVEGGHNCSKSGVGYSYNVHGRTAGVVGPGGKFYSIS